MASLQDALAYFNTDKHQWYGWINLEDGEVYSNLKLNDDTATMPSEEEVNAKIAELQTSLMIFFIMDLMAGKLQYKKQKINTLNLNKNRMIKFIVWII
jgi:hypothetical protein